ncbi:MAG: hypothetical protein AB7H88_10290 [Vicinamibacterales bacterium]
MTQAAPGPEAVLAAFVRDHAGLRLGRVFGDAGAFAGRRLFARVVDGGLALRLPPSAAAAARQAGAMQPPAARPLRGWTHFRPRTVREAARLGPLLEVAARHVATDGGSTGFSSSSGS